MTLSPLLKKLLFVRQFSIDGGKINLLGEREVMLDASAILELQSIDESKLYDIGKKASFKNLVEVIEHARVYSSMKDLFIAEIANLGKKIGQTDKGTLMTLKDFFNIYGLGELSVDHIDNSKKEALVSIKESTLAQEWMAKNKKKSKSAVCALTAGIIAGMFSYVFDKQMDCVESKCSAQGASKCSFKVAA